MAKIISKRLAQLLAAPSLETLRNIGGRCHELKADFTGCFALDLIHPKRLIFKPDDENRTYMDGKTILWPKVISVEIIDIVDYH